MLIFPPSIQNKAERMDDSSPEKRQELKAFFFLTVVMAPAIAGTVIVAYGFAVWVFQMFAGPPGS